ncbi:hypothetical protein P152DRAFT_481484 [Eremomyces bilateralis CBS 781.70]|uniref:BZIP domain-containing protein n=1 Tax=Eremomyces bilateralis CBS 781.70 TaxID=1392243 RepID=A0A6G1G616_9PEZI|nr:uncharacterized protein P152DRAFT_481484 [Eremomyces bilateralis CBS 781.70]KAF1813391.1 hypothetical protein P152DRAFT_481484 [Eremomyces bilateralis CBS 781.70]
MASAGGPPGELEDAPQTATTRSKLTTAQRRERKRKLDREAQRAVREKTKNHIAYLEGLVKALQNPEGNDGRMQELVAQIENGHEEAKVLKEALGSIGKIVNGIAKNGNDEDHMSIVKSEDRGPPGSGDMPGQSAVASSSTSPPESNSTSIRSMSGDQQAGNLPSRTNPFASGAAQAEASNPIIDEPLYGVIDAEPYIQDHRSTGGNSVPTAAGAAFANATPTVPPYPLVNPALIEQGRSIKSLDGTVNRQSSDDFNNSERYWSSYSIPPLTNETTSLVELKQVIKDTVNMVMMSPGLQSKFWYLGGMILQHLLNRPDAPLTPRHMDEDIAIRACLHGWQAVEQQYVLDGCWQWLKVLDTHMYSHLGFPERMAILRIKRTKFLAQVKQDMTYELKLPAFMKPRPAQENVQHDALVEYFVWPGMREHILFSPTKYATDAFMEPFRQNLHFLWPHEPQDIYQRDHATGLYNFSDLWTSHMAHIGCWRINSDFFEVYPHLRPDIPCSTESPVNSRALVKKTFNDVARRICTSETTNRADGAGRGSVSLFGEQDEEEQKQNENEQFCSPHTMATVPVDTLLSFTTRN